MDRAAVDTDAVVLKKITFTDRPSLIGWIDANYTKVIQVGAKIASMDIEMNCQCGRLETSEGIVQGYSFYQTRWDINDTDRNSMHTTVIEIDYETTEFTYESSLHINRTDKPDGELNGYVNFVPDEYWPAMGISCTFLYYE